MPKKAQGSRKDRKWLIKKSQKVTKAGVEFNITLVRV